MILLAMHWLLGLQKASTYINQTECWWRPVSIISSARSYQVVAAFAGWCNFRLFLAGAAWHVDKRVGSPAVILVGRGLGRRRRG